MENNVTVGSLLSTTLAIFVKRLPQLAGVAVIAYLPQMAFSISVANRPDQPLAVFGLFPLMMIGSFIAQGAITVATYHDLRGQGFQLGAGLSRAFSKFLFLIGLAIATTVMVFLGYLLLIIPGIMLALALFVAVPALMVEDLNIGNAISRSFELTAGYRLRILGLSILAGLVVVVPFTIVSVVLGLVMDQTSMLYNILNTLISGIAGTVTSVAAVVTYYRLREDVDGVGLEELDEVFA